MHEHGIDMTDHRLEQLFAHLHRGGSWAYYWTAPDENGLAPGGAERHAPQGREYLLWGAPYKRQARQQSTRADHRHLRRKLPVRRVRRQGLRQSQRGHAGAHSRAGIAAIRHHRQRRGISLLLVADEPYPIAGDTERERIDRIQKAWVAFVGSDDGAKDLARVLRVPGTTNGKYTHPAR